MRPARIIPPPPAARLPVLPGWTLAWLRTTHILV